MLISDKADIKTNNVTIDNYERVYPPKKLQHRHTQQLSLQNMKQTLTEETDNSIIQGGDSTTALLVTTSTTTKKI